MKTTDYHVNGITFQGLYYQQRDNEDTPLVILYHEYMGLQPFIFRTAERLVSKGVNVFVADLYGQGIRPGSHQEAHPLYRQLKQNPARLRERAVAAVSHARTLRNHGSDGSAPALVLMGFSLGGAAALEAAGACGDVSLTILVYSHLMWGSPASKPPVSGNLLLFHGMQDTVVPFDHLVRFTASLKSSAADSELILYADAGHGFCNPAQPSDPDKGLGFHRLSCDRTWERILTALQRLKASGLNPNTWEKR